MKDQDGSWGVTLQMLQPQRRQPLAKAASILEKDGFKAMQAPGIG